MAKLQELYQDFVTSQPPDFSIDIGVVDRLSSDQIEKALPRSVMHSDGDRMFSTELTLEGRIDRDKHYLNLTVEKHLFDAGLDFKLMNRIIPVIYSTICHEKYGTLPDFLVHSCGIVRKGHAMLFTGPSEVGKTTIGRFCGDEYGKVLNDEVTLVSRPGRDGGPILVQGAPIIGGVPHRPDTAAPLRCVLLLKQSHRTQISPVGKIEAHLKFMHQVISPAHLGPYNHRILLSLVEEFSSEVVKTTPFYRLEFTLDREPLWKAVSELEKTLEKEEQQHVRPTG
jgi:hypothetical protein